VIWGARASDKVHRITCRMNCGRSGEWEEVVDDDLEEKKCAYACLYMCVRACVRKNTGTGAMWSSDRISRRNALRGQSVKVDAVSCSDTEH
jgi:hypothetical protein